MIRTILFILLFITNCYSQYQIGLNGGTSLKIKPAIFREEWKNGVSFGLYWSHNLTKNFDLLVKLDYSLNKYNKSLKIWEDYDIEGGDVKIIIPSVGVKFIPTSRENLIKPFISFSLGYEFLSQNSTKLTSNNFSHTVNGKKLSGLGTITGLGVEINYVKNFSFIIQSDYNILLTDITQLLSLQTLIIKLGIGYYL